MVGIRLASGVVTPLLKKLFHAEGAGAGLVDRPVRISSYASPREQRVLSRDDLHRLAGKLVAEALRAPGEQALPPGEQAGVATALAVTLHALGDLTLADAEAVAMGPRAFAAELRRTAPATGLGRDAELFHDRLLEATCLHVLHFFTTRSTYIPRALVESARRQAETIAKIDALLARIPRQDGRDAEFEARYRKYLADRLGSLTIFGLDLPPAPRAGRSTRRTSAWRQPPGPTAPAPVTARSPPPPKSCWPTSPASCCAAKPAPERPR